MKTNELMKLTQEQVARILKRHRMWMNKKPKGERATFENVDISGLNFGNQDLRGVCFSNTIAVGTDFSQSRLGYNTFTKCDISGATFEMSEGYAVAILQCNATGVRFVDAKMKSMEIDGSDITGANFTRANLRMSKFTNLISMEGVVFAKNNITGMRMENIPRMMNMKMDSVMFTESCIQNVNLAGANLYNVRFIEKSGANTLKQSNVQNANVSGNSYFEKDGSQHPLGYYAKHREAIEAGKIIPISSDAVSYASMPAKSIY